MYKYELMMVKMVLNSRLSYMEKGFSSSLATVVGITSDFFSRVCVCAVCTVKYVRSPPKIPCQSNGQHVFRINLK